MTAVDSRSERSLFAAPRISSRFAVSDEAASLHLAQQFDAQLPRDPMYPDRQLVRSTYLAPVDAARERPSFLRVREYLGAADAAGADGPRAGFLELKHVGADGRKSKERVRVAANAIELLRDAPRASTVERIVAPGADPAIVARAARLLETTPHVLEAGTEYGRRAWEDVSGTLRVTLDDVAADGAALGRETITRRVLEVKHAPDLSLPDWLRPLLDDALDAGTLEAIRPGSTAPPPAAIDDAARAAAAAMRALR